MRINSSSELWLFPLGTALLLLGLHYGLALHFLAAAVLSLAAWRLTAHKQTPQWLAALPCLMFCLWAAPELSDDYHRYLWEGFVQNQGHSPYRESPAKLAGELDHPSVGRINHPEYTAIYPPLAQLCFRFAALFGPTVLPWKLFILLSLCLPLLSPSYRARFGWLLAMPLLLVEGLWNAHLDVLGVALGAGLVLAMERRRPALAGGLLAAMVGIKLLPLLFAPACLKHLEGRDRIRFLGALAVLSLLIFAPYAADGAQLFASFRAFAGQWSFNNPLFWALKTTVGAELARPCLAISLLLAIAWIVWLKHEFSWQCTALWLALTLFSPTVFPWYLLWLLPFVPLARARWLILLYAACFLSYAVLFGYRSVGLWRESPLWMAPEWLLMAWAALRLLEAPGGVQPEDQPGR